jgi:hypothetical protein
VTTRLPARDAGVRVGASALLAYAALHHLGRAAGSTGAERRATLPAPVVSGRSPLTTHAA